MHKEEQARISNQPRFIPVIWQDDPGFCCSSVNQPLYVVMSECNERQDSGIWAYLVEGQIENLQVGSFLVQICHII